jgi:hypothetical protein
MHFRQSLRRLGGAAIAAACVLAVSTAASAKIDDFPGKWVNVDAHTNNLTKVHIDMAGPMSVDVHGWGQCHPTDCDWGTVHGQFIPGGGGTVRATFNSSFSVTVLELHNAPGQSLSYDMHTKFIDNSGRAPYDVHGVLARAGDGGMGGGGMGGGHPHFDDLAGVWHNVDPATNNLTRVKLEPQSFPDIRVRGWGQCHPTDCDWGAVMGNFEQGGWVHATFDSGFSITKLDLHREPGDKLSYTMHVKFTDHSGRAPYDVSGWLTR